MRLVVGLIPDPTVYDGVENPKDFADRIYSFLDELTAEYAGREVNVMIAGHKCTTGCIDCYFNGMPSDGDFFSRSVSNGNFRIYDVRK